MWWMFSKVIPSLWGSVRETFGPWSSEDRWADSLAALFLLCAHLGPCLQKNSHQPFVLRQPVSKVNAGWSSKLKNIPRPSIVSGPALHADVRGKHTTKPGHQPCFSSMPQADAVTLWSWCGDWPLLFKEKMINTLHFSITNPPCSYGYLWLCPERLYQWISLGYLLHAMNALLWGHELWCSVECKVVYWPLFFG